MSTSLPPPRKKRLNLGNDSDADADADADADDGDGNGNGPSSGPTTAGKPKPAFRLGGGAGGNAAAAEKQQVKKRRVNPFNAFNKMGATGGRKDGSGGGGGGTGMESGKRRVGLSLPPPPSSRFGGATGTADGNETTATSESSTSRPEATRPKPKVPPVSKQEEEEEEEEELDYLSLPIPTTTTSTTSTGTASRKPTLTQLHQQKLRRAELASSTPSKAALLEQANRAREEGLARSLLEDGERKGVRLMKAMGWGGGVLGKKQAQAQDSTPPTDSPLDTPYGGGGGGGGGGLGYRAPTEPENPQQPPRQTPLLEPLTITIKQDRGGIGHASEEMRRFRTSASRLTSTPTTTSSIDQADGESTDAYRARISQSRAEKRAEAQLYAAQNILEELTCESNNNNTSTNPTTTTTTTTPNDTTNKSLTPDETPLSAIPILYRSSVKHRREKEVRQRERFALAEGLAAHHLLPHLSGPKPASRPKITNPNAIYLPDSDSENEDESVSSTALFAHDAPLTHLAHDDGMDDVDGGGEDGELQEWEGMTFVERRDRVVRELREKWRYCFWCKYRYKDEGEMEEGCPGEDEDVHG